MTKKVILASGSPRRKELLSRAGVVFEVHSPDINEDVLHQECSKSMVKRLSLEKALEVWRNVLRADESAIIIAADTTVVDSGGRILGKPVNEAEAVKMIKALQGKVHQVHTGYTVIDVVRGQVKKKITRVVETRVWIGSMTPVEIKKYVSQGECLDKAGAYAAQGFGMLLIEKISGSYTNVIGLPMTQLMKDLKALGWKS